MSKNPLDKYMKHDKFGKEYWSAREIQKLFGYQTWQDLAKVAREVIQYMKSYGMDPKQHIRECDTVLQVKNRDGRIEKKKFLDYALSRSAVYWFVVFSDRENEIVSRMIVHMIRNMAYYEKQDIVEQKNKELFEVEKESFSVLEWAEAYIQERIASDKYALDKKSRFKTLLFGLTRKTGSKEYAIEHADILDKMAGGVYYQKAKSIARTLLHKFRFIENVEKVRKI